jgi:hypothetical protein
MIQADLPFEEDTAEQLMAIAHHPVVCKWSADGSR